MFIWFALIYIILINLFITNGILRFFLLGQNQRKICTNSNHLDARRLHRVWSRCNELGLQTKGCWQILWCNNRSFPCSHLGTLARKTSPIHPIHIQSQIKPVGYHYGMDFIIKASILAFDYLFTGRRRGANELLANRLYWNNNLFLANIDSLMYF